MVRAGPPGIVVDSTLIAFRSEIAQHPAGCTDKVVMVAVKPSK
jgi:hypothetical protein